MSKDSASILGDETMKNLPINGHSQHATIRSGVITCREQTVNFFERCRVGNREAAIQLGARSHLISDGRAGPQQNFGTPSIILIRAV